MSKDPVRKVTEAADSTRWQLMDAFEVEAGFTAIGLKWMGIEGLLDASEARLLGDTLLAAAEVLESQREAFESAKKYVESQDREGLVHLASQGIHERAKQAVEVLESRKEAP